MYYYRNLGIRYKTYEQDPCLPIQILMDVPSICSSMLKVLPLKIQFVDVGRVCKLEIRNGSLKDW